jgi:fibronectin type 3 domain-containing protein
MSTATLNWNAATSAAVVSYRIYYGAASGSYLQPRGSGIAAASTTYVIQALTKGQLYYFAVTSVDSLGNESGYSNEATKIIQ